MTRLQKQKYQSMELRRLFVETTIEFGKLYRKDGGGDSSIELEVTNQRL